MLSAKNIFFTKPKVNNKIPNFIFSFEKMIFFLKDGINSLALNIGPAINCGKYNKNSLNEKKVNLTQIQVSNLLNQMMEEINKLKKKITCLCSWQIEKLIGRKVSFYLASKFLSDKPHIIIFNKDDEK